MTEEATQENSPGAAHSPAWLIALAALAALAVAMGVGRFAFTPILPMMRDDAGLSLADGGWLASANYAGYLLGALSAIVIRLRSGIAIRGGLLTIGLTTFAMGLTQQFFLWAVLRTVAGIASAWALVFVSAWALENLAQRGRPRLIGAVYAGIGAGIIAAGGLCLFLMNLHSTSAAAWLTLGVVSLVVTAAIWPFFKMGAVLPAGARQAAEPAALTKIEFWRLVISYGGYGFGYIIPATFLPVMAKEVISDPQLFGWAWPAFGAAAIASTLIAARMQTFMTHRNIWIASVWVMALGLVFPLVLPGLAGIVAAAICVGGTFVVVTMAGVQEARDIAGAQARMLIAAMTAAFGLGQIVGPLSVRMFTGSVNGFNEALMFAAAILVFSSFLIIRLPTGKVD